MNITDIGKTNANIGIFRQFYRANSSGSIVYVITKFESVQSQK